MPGNNVHSVRALGLAGFALVALAGCGEPAGGGCADPLILDQMRRESAFAAGDAVAERVRLTDPQRMSAEADILGCRATWTVEAPFARLVPVVELGYPFTLEEARQAFDEATGMLTGRIEAAGEYLRKRAAAGKAATETVTLSAPVVYRIARRERPFLLDWSFESTDIAAEAGRRFAASVARERAREREEELALARSRGFDSIEAMREAEAEARAARERLREAEAARNEAAGRLDTLLRELDAVEQALSESADTAQRLEKRLSTERADGEDWTRRIKRESFARDNDRLEFSDTRVFSGESSFGTEEQAVITTVVNFSDETYYAADFHVVVWHAELQRFFEDRSMHADFGREGLSPGESHELRLSLNGRPGVGLAFTGDAFRSPGERHAFLFVNKLKNDKNRIVYRDRWRSPAAARRADEQALVEARQRGADLETRLAELKKAVAEQREKLERAERRAAELEADLPPLPSEMDGGGS